MFLNEVFIVVSVISKISTTETDPAPTYAMNTFHGTLYNRERGRLSDLWLSVTIQKYLDLTTFVYLTEIQLQNISKM